MHFNIFEIDIIRGYIAHSLQVDFRAKGRPWVKSKNAQ
jgi:hypothetical protein